MVFWELDGPLGGPGEGSILKAGTSEELAGDDEVRRLYLGESFQLHR
ncbi:MAG: hypothetical protein R6U62_06265 [Bacteroidales bacterium]